MAHKYPANEGDYLKHVVLEDLLKQLIQTPGVQHIRYIDPYAGEGFFTLASARHTPSGPPAKVATWANQQPNPPYYLGSPLIALQVLHQSGQPFSLRLSDRDGTAVGVLAKALSGKVPNYTPPQVPQDSEVKEATFDGSQLGSFLTRQPSAVNVILLDPSLHPGYSTVIKRSNTACRENDCNCVLMCWGLKKWKWPTVLLGETQREQAEYLQGRYPSVVHLLWFGGLSSQLATAARAAAQGW
jgi:23S rRNA A2030 N6-methylase RlmJ